MESFSGEMEEGTEDAPGQKKSKLKSLRSRLFGRRKRADGDDNAKLSQSSGDITARAALGSDEDLFCSQGMMGSRALSHDSIFLADLAESDADPARVLSHENVHSKIKALQVKLQQQKMHLGPPPLVLPIRRTQDQGSHMEDDSLTSSLPEISEINITTQGPPSKAISQTSCPPFLPIIPKPTLAKSVSSTPSSFFVPSTSPPSVVEPPLDLSAPPKFTPCLDTSAARHRMSVKPKHQRASTKGKRHPTTNAHLHTINNIDHPVCEKEEEQEIAAEEEVVHLHSTQILKTGQGEPNVAITSQCLPFKSQEKAPITSEPSEAQAASKPCSSTLSHQDPSLPVTPSSKPHRPLDVMSSEQAREKSEDIGDLYLAVLSGDNADGLNNTDTISIKSNEVSVKPASQLHTSSDSMMALKSSSVHQQVQGQEETIRGIKRSTPGSLHLNINQREKNLQTDEGIKIRNVKPREDLVAVGGQGVLHKGSILPWDRRDSVKKDDSITVPRCTPIKTGAVEAMEVEESREVAGEATQAEETQEEKTTFGVKLRSTSLSKKTRSDTDCTVSDFKMKHDRAEIGSPTASSAPYNFTSKFASAEEQSDKRKGQETGNSMKPPPSTTSGVTRQTDVYAKEETVLSAPRESQSAPQTTSSEVSWMSLAMEKTRSLQQLLSSRIPRDFKAAAQPQTQVQPPNQSQTLSKSQKVTHSETLIGTQTEPTKTQQCATQPQAMTHTSTDSVTLQTTQSVSQTHTPKMSLTPTATQQNPLIAPISQSHTSWEPKQSNEPTINPNIKQPLIQSPLHGSPRGETTPQFAQGSAAPSLAQYYLSSGQQAKPQQPSWSNRGLQLKSTPTVSNSVSSSAPTPVSALGKGEKATTVQGIEGPSLSDRRAVFAGAVGEKAALLEKKAESATPPTTKVDLKKIQTETRTPAESPILAQTTALIKDTRQEGRQDVKLAESSPVNIPDRHMNHEDKWLRKNVSSSLPPSSSPMPQSPGQPEPDSGRPSWMELAKKKSMAWSDKNVD